MTTTVRAQSSREREEEEESRDHIFELDYKYIVLKVSIRPLAAIFSTS